MKNLLIAAAANIAHALHAFRHGIASHRLITHSVKAHGAVFYRAQHMECECGKVFATLKQQHPN